MQAVVPEHFVHGYTHKSPAAKGNLLQEGLSCSSTALMMETDIASWDGPLGQDMGSQNGLFRNIQYTKKFTKSLLKPLLNNSLNNCDVEKILHRYENKE